MSKKQDALMIFAKDRGLGINPVDVVFQNTYLRISGADCCTNLRGNPPNVFLGHYKVQAMGAVAKVQNIFLKNSLFYHNLRRFDS